MAKKRNRATGKRPGRFVVYTLAKRGRGYRTLGRFHRKETARSFAQAESLAREGTVYVDEELGRGKGEPIATYVSGRSMRI